MFDINELKQNGFKGFIKIKDLDINTIQKEKGIYVIINKNQNMVFLDKSNGGHFKGKDPTVSMQYLKENWVDNVDVIYIGQAGGNGSNATLLKRIKQYIQFGSGKPIGHWGGRLIWQIKDSGELLIAWKSTNTDPYDIETELIYEFKLKYGKRPFANLSK